ncbi:MAG: sigma 54-interacting transcriptional regulator [Chlorobiaceae bacterium]|nr:sigma 54-interacting transcriptional regulator [Chlorobiaceae bacterium]
MDARTINESRQLMQYISNAIGTIREPQELFRTVTDRLRLMFDFDSVAIITLDREQQYVNIFFGMLRFELPDHLKRQKFPIAGSWLEDHLDDHSVSTVPISDFLSEKSSRDITLLNLLYGQGMRHLTFSPLLSGGRLIGFLTFISRDAQVWSEIQSGLLADVSLPIAIAVSNALAFDELRQREAETAMQLAVNNAILTIRDRSAMMLAVCGQIGRLMPYDFMGIRVVGQDGKYLSSENFMREPGNGYVEFSPEEFLDIGPEKERFVRESLELISRPGVYSGEVFEELCREFELVAMVRDRLQIRSFISFELWNSYGSRAGLFMARKQAPFGLGDLETIRLIIPQLSLALQNYFAFEQIDRLRRKLEGERTYLIEEIRAGYNFEEIIGSSDALAAVLQRVSQVAPTDATVLIQGETGTGKELIARAIHNLSPRKEQVLVRVNCAALPAALIESELFGHEKGSFTGAIERRIGKFELADGGTIFLDEVGELPLELQSKLLRVLQERELERVGGRRVIPVNVRVVAATNRDLEKEVASHRFREDLYFRLNVFPLYLPPLRERRDDIQPLAMHFARKFAREFGKPVRVIREADIRELASREWRGNIRELAHCIEQAVIMSEGETLDFITNSHERTTHHEADMSRTATMTLPELEAEMKNLELKIILEALDKAGGRVSGEGGAACLLDINPKTLYSRLDALGIRKKYTKR